MVEKHWKNLFGPEISRGGRLFGFQASVEFQFKWFPLKWTI